MPLRSACLGFSRPHARVLAGLLGGICARHMPSHPGVSSKCSGTFTLACTSNDHLLRYKSLLQDPEFDIQQFDRAGCFPSCQNSWTSACWWLFSAYGTSVVSSLKAGKHDGLPLAAVSIWKGGPPTALHARRNCFKPPSGLTCATSAPTPSLALLSIFFAVWCCPKPTSIPSRGYVWRTKTIAPVGSTCGNFLVAPFRLVTTLRLVATSG